MIDSHCHLADETFAPDLDAVVASRPRCRARAGAGHPRSGAMPRKPRRRVASMRSGRRCALSIGVHPHQAHQFAGDPERRRGGRARAVRGDAVGARGRRDRPRLPLRLLAARRAAGGVPRAAAAGARADRPVVIHTREADDDTVAILREEGGGQLRGVLHCFTGDAGAGATRASTSASTSRSPAS